MTKYLAMFVAVSTLFISGCVDLLDSDSGSGNEFLGAWDTPCENTHLDTLTIPQESLVISVYTFENIDCTGTKTEDFSIDYGLAFEDQVTTASGVKATRVRVIIDADEGLEALELMYRDGNNLYLGDGTDTSGTWATDIDYDFVLTKQ